MRGVLSVAACFFLACFVNDVTESSDTGTVGGSGPGTSTGGSTTGTGGDGAGVCTDGVQNGDETDVDCGGGCDPCVDGLLCSEHADCEGVCVLGVCERAVVVSGTAKAALQSLLAFYIWGNTPTTAGLAGIASVLGGSLLYTQVKMQEAEEADKSRLPHTVTKA